MNTDLITIQNLKNEIIQNNKLSRSYDLDCSSLINEFFNTCLETRDNISSSYELENGLVTIYYPNKSIILKILRLLFRRATHFKFHESILQQILSLFSVIRKDMGLYNTKYTHCEYILFCL